MKLAWPLLLLWLAPLGASAQSSGPPEPILRATLDPPRVVVGQPVMLRIELLAPNYLTRPPNLPDLQLRNAVTRDLGSINMSEPHGGMTYAGVRRELAIHPQEPGSYVIANRQVVVAYAAEPPASREATLDLPRLVFEAFIPDAAQALDPFVAATKLVLHQSVEPASGERKVGDAVIRTITIEAEGIPAMLLPATSFARPEGLAVYPDQPTLQDRSDRRTDVLTATRVDRVTYMLEKPGDYVLPAIELAWWDLRGQRIVQARADPVALSVAANPALPQRAGENPVRARWRDAVAALAAHWPLVALATGLLAGLAWLLPRALRIAWHWIERRRVAYRRSEAAAFASLRKAAQSGDHAKTYFALLAWLERFEPVAPAHTIAAFRAAARDGALDRQLALIEDRLFAAPARDEAAGWAPRQMLRPVATARRRLRHRSTLRTGAAPPLAALNPAMSQGSSVAQRRPVAR